MEILLNYLRLVNTRLKVYTFIQWGGSQFDTMNSAAKPRVRSGRIAETVPPELKGRSLSGHFLTL